AWPFLLRFGKLAKTAFGTTAAAHTVNSWPKPSTSWWATLWSNCLRIAENPSEHLQGGRKARGAGPKENLPTPHPGPFSFLPVPAEIDIAIMPFQEIHESFVVRVGHAEQRKHLFVAAASPLQPFPYDVFDLILCDHAFRVRPCDRLPEVAYDQLIKRP